MLYRVFEKMHMLLRTKMQTGTLAQNCESIHAKYRGKKFTRCDEDYNIVLSSQNLTKRLQRVYISEI